MQIMGFFLVEIPTIFLEPILPVSQAAPCTDGCSTSAATKTL